MIRNDRCQGEGSGEEVDAHQRKGEWWEGGCFFTFFSQTQQLFVGAGDLGMQGTLVPLWASHLTRVIQLYAISREGEPLASMWAGYS